MQNLKQYILLVRLPNIFTTPSNILAGYFSLIGSHNINFFHISLLVLSSALLYMYGIILNDYFDIETDRKERPSRPLPSGRISARTALVLAIVALVVANVTASLVSIASLLISIILSIIIFAYDYGLKRSKFGPLAMSTTRFLNVFFGASPALYSWYWQNNYQHTDGSGITIANTFFAAGSMFAYIYAITLLSRIEVGAHSKQAHRRITRLAFTIIIAIICGTILLALYRGEIEMSISIVLFVFAIYYALRNTTAVAITATEQQPQALQNAIRILLLSIIILDSIFITAFADLYYAILTLALTIIPSTILARKLYVT
jgi:4-hydroxybenzoate polyprenyltransferase